MPIYDKPYLGRIFYHYIQMKFIFYEIILLQCFYGWVMGGWILAFYIILSAQNKVFHSSLLTSTFNNV